MPGPPIDEAGGFQPFPETSWALVLACGDRGDPAYRTSLEVLCRRYWAPVHSFVRRYRSEHVEDARDLTQSFFVSLLERGTLGVADAERGRFRTFLCAALRNFLTNERRASRALRRAPGAGVVSIERLREGDATFEIPDRCSPETDEVFLAEWRQAVVANALGELRRDARRQGKEPFVDFLVGYDLERVEARLTYRDLAERFGVSESRVTNGLAWARREFVRRLREEIANQTVGDVELERERRAILEPED